MKQGGPAFNSAGPLSLRSSFSPGRTSLSLACQLFSPVARMTSQRRIHATQAPHAGSCTFYRRFVCGRTTLHHNRSYALFVRSKAAYNHDSDDAYHNGSGTDHTYNKRSSANYADSDRSGAHDTDRFRSGNDNSDHPRSGYSSAAACLRHHVAWSRSQSQWLPAL